MKNFLFILILLIPLKNFAQNGEINFIDSLTLFIAIDGKIISSKEVKEIYWTYYDSLNNMYYINCHYKIGKILIDKNYYDLWKSKIAKWSKITILYQNKNDKDSVYVYEIVDDGLIFHSYADIINYEKEHDYYYCDKFGKATRCFRKNKKIILAPSFSGWIPNNEYTIIK